MCGPNDDPSMIELMESLERGTKQLADDMMRDINQEMILYPPTPKTEEEMEERLQFDDVVENALWDMMKEGLIE